MGDFYNRGGGSLVLTDLQVDGTTVVVDETNDRVGIGTESPGVQLDVQDTTTSSANTGGALRLSANDGAAMGDSHRLGVVEFTGAEDTSNTQVVGARIEAMTEAAWTNAENGCALYFYTTDGNASQSTVFKLDSDKRASFTGKVGIGDSVPGTSLQITDTEPYLTMKNSTSENTAGGCESKMIFEDHGNNALGQIEVSHVGTSDDEYGQLIIKTNNDSGLQTALTISETQTATFANTITCPGVSLTDGASINISAPPLSTADHTNTGLTAQMLAGGAIGAFETVCVHTVASEVVITDSNAIGTMPCIGIATAAISDTATGTILLQGFIRDDTWNWTVGGILYASETAGAMTQTAPTTSGAFVQALGIAFTADVVYFNPSLTLVEVA